ncbi:MAG: aminotransferase class I/II-fold pyridoxal phosphate-dependent enzyme [Actinomycetota bacterium]
MTAGSGEVRTIDPLAVELNEVLRENAPHLYRCLSNLGKELFFPRGILTHTAEAKRLAYRYNATIGMATQNGRPMYLRTLRKYIKNLKVEEAFPYSPTSGIPELRRLWKDHLLAMSPGLEGKSFSLPVVTSGLTHGLSIMADMFCDAGDPLLLPDMSWGNYRMIFAVRRGARILRYPLFDLDGRLDVGAFSRTLASLPRPGKALVLLNFPHNPTGYTPDRAEAASLIAALLDAADQGLDLVVGVDDAYTGLFYEPDSFQESFFSLLADCHSRITAVKIDGPTKEDYAWGFRVGFITLSHRSPGKREAVYEALEKKVAGLIRSTISKCATPSQHLLVKAIKAVGYWEEKKEKFNVLVERYREVKRVLGDPRFEEAFSPFPFNSGYFLCLRLHEVDAEILRRHLLERYGVGVVATGPRELRIAYSCLEKEQIADLFDILYEAAREVRERESVKD